MAVNPPDRVNNRRPPPFMVRFGKWQATLDLTPTDHLVALTLAVYANGDRRAWPGRVNLAADCNVSIETIDRSLGRLVRAGVVRVVDRGSGPGHAAVFELADPPWPLPKVVTGDDFARSSKSSSDPLKVVKRGAESRHLTPSKSSPVTTQEVEDKKKRVEEARGTRVAGTSTSSPNHSHRPTAERILNDWWERQQPRPVTPWPACRAVLERALTAGWTPDDLARALDEIPVVSGAALDFWRRRPAGATRSNRNQAARDAVLDAIDAGTRRQLPEGGIR